MDATFADQRCQEIVNALEHEAVVVGIDGLIYAANEQLAARLGSCTAAQIIGKPLTELLTTARSSLPTRTDAALASSAPRWEALRRLMDSSTSAGSTTLADGAAAQHSHDAREEAARKLITNHEAVVRDVTNASPMTQPQLQRVTEAAAPYVDQALREVARRLLGRRPGAGQLQESVDPATAAQTARYLHSRIQSTDAEKPGRTPDMSTAAAAAMRSVLAEVGGLEACPRWEALRRLMDSSTSAGSTTLADGAAAQHSHDAREEAARKLITNHEAVVRDVTNPNPKSQRQLQRVTEAAAPYVDQMLREVARRLLGRRGGSAELEETLDPSTPAQMEAWAGASRFLDGRVQASAEMPRRTPDMSIAAAAAFRAVLREVGDGEPSSTAAVPMDCADAVADALSASAPRWAALHRELDEMHCDGLCPPVVDELRPPAAEEADGAAAQHSHDAREEAARKLITNHEAVVRDVTNPNPKSQRQLQRVTEAAAPYVDQMLREVARRLLGRRPALQELEETLDPSVLPAQVEAWAVTARYLRARTQATPDHQPGRKPDMGEGAAAALRAVLEEVGGVASSPLEELLLAAAQGRASIAPRVEVAWRGGGGVDVREVRISPLYDPQSGSMHHLLVGLFAERAAMLTQGLGVARLPSPHGADGSSGLSDEMEAEVSPCGVASDAPSDPAARVEGLRNVSRAAHALLQAPGAPLTAWAVVFASALQKAMFKTVLLTRPCSEKGYEIWHASRGLEEMLGVAAGALLGRDCSALCPHGLLGAHSTDDLHHAVASRTGGLVETVISSGCGAPLFCLAYVMPLHCEGARRGTTAIAFLDVHRSLPYMQKQMEARGLADCDLYTFVKFSLLNCLITDPSSPNPAPERRNPIVFASAGFSAMSGATTEECLGRNCRFLQQQFMGLRGRAGEAPPQSAEQIDAIAHMAATLNARQESLTLLLNFRADGSRFANLLFMTPIMQEGPSDGGVLFWVGVQHPVDEAMVRLLPTAPTLPLPDGSAAAAAAAAAEHARLLRSCQQSVQSLQLQQLSSAHTAGAHRTAIAIRPTAPGARFAGCATVICRLCEHQVLADELSSHTQMCKVVSQCRTIVEHADGTLSRLLCRLNAAASSVYLAGSCGSEGGRLVELLRTYTSALLGATAASHVLVQLSALQPKLEELTAAMPLPPAAELCWADIKAAGQRKLAALQHAVPWSSELIPTVVPCDNDDPLSHAQAPCLSDFQVVRELQRGSHGAVFMVKKVRTGDVFAMKVLDTSRARAHRLATERKVLFLCDSPFVIRTFFAFEDAARLYLVMECMHSDCKQLVQQCGVVPEMQARGLMADLVLALEHMHGCGVYHRDLKPENLLLTREGRLKLADFGLSQVVPPPSSSPQQASGVPEDDTAHDPSIVGTPFYMAPEVLQGRARGIEAASEWWSCGVILYEFLTGFPPFQGRKVADIYRAILQRACIVPIQKCNVSREAADLVQRWLVLQPRERLVGALAVKAHPFFRTVDWPSHAQPRAAGRGQMTVPTTQSLAAQNKSYGPAQAASSSDTAVTARASDDAPAASAIGSCGRSGDSHDGSKSSDSKRSEGSILSAASTQDFDAKRQLQLQLLSEKTDAHLDNLKELNDEVARRAQP